MGRVDVSVKRVDKYNEALELANALELKVVDVSISGKWKDSNGATYQPATYEPKSPAQEKPSIQALQWIGQKWAFIDTDHGVKKCKPKPVAGARGTIHVTLTDE